MSLMLSFGVNQESDIIITVCLTAHGGGYLIVDQYVVVTSQLIPTQTISNKITNQMAVRQPEPSTPPPDPDCYPSYSVWMPASPPLLCDISLFSNQRYLKPLLCLSYGFIFPWYLINGFPFNISKGTKGNILEGISEVIG
jgi:hypothetical protein